MVTINIVKEFSRTPGPRYISEGDFSGELFRKEILLPHIKEAMTQNCKITVDLDGASGYGTSFLEEAFGGLIRIDLIPYEFLKNNLIIKSDEDDIYIDEINEYMEHAHKVQLANKGKL